MPADERHDVFLSYSREDDGRADRDDPDASFARRLYDGLSAAGLRVWWDHLHLPTRGMAFDDEIRAAIDRCERLVLIFGPGVARVEDGAVKGSSYVWDEVEYALERCTVIHPILRKGDYKDIPERLGRLRLHTPDFRDDARFEARLEELVRGVLDEAPAPLGALHGVPLLPRGYVRRAPALDALESIVRRDAGKTIVLASRSRSSAEQASTLYGMGGIGKTTLAAGLALDCDIRRTFPDGIYWIEVGRTPNIPARQHDIGRYLNAGEPLDLYRDEQSGKNRLTTLLEDKAALIILDNVWDKTHVDWLMVNAPRTRFLVTTRSQRLAGLLTDGAHTLHLDLLTPEEAAELIGQWVGESSASGEGETEAARWAVYRAIAAEVGYHTLAVKIAAARLAERGAEDAPKLLERLKARKADNPFKDLQLGDDKEVNVETSLAESTLPLSADRQRRFRLLGVFVPDGTFDAPAAAAVWGDEEADEAEDALVDFEKASLLTRMPEGRWGQHNLLHAYARALAAQAGELADAQARHFGHYVARFGDHERNNDEDTHDDIKAAFTNIRAALAWGNAAQPEAASLWASALVYYMSLRESYSVWREVIAQGRDAAASAHFALGEANTLRALGDLALREAGLAEARAAYERALAIYEGIGARLGQANTLRALGDLAAAEGDHPAALNRYAQTIALAESIGDAYTAAIGRASAAPSLAALGRQEEAVSALLEAMVFFIDKGIHDAVGAAVNRLRALRGQLTPAVFDPLWAKLTGGQALPDWLGGGGG